MNVESRVLREKSDAANGNGLLTVAGAFLIDKSKQITGGGMPVSSGHRRFLPPPANKGRMVYSDGIINCFIV